MASERLWQPTKTRSKSMLPPEARELIEAQRAEVHTYRRLNGMLTGDPAATESRGQVCWKRLTGSFGIRAYRVRRGAPPSFVRGFSRPVDGILRLQGLDGLKALPAVGETIARAIRELVSGRPPLHRALLEYRAGASCRKDA